MEQPFCPCCGDDADADEEQARLMAQPAEPVDVADPAIVWVEA